MKVLNILLFGQIAEKLDSSIITYHTEAKTIDELRSALLKSYPVLQSYSFTIAIDKEIGKEDAEIRSDAEIALLPPFSGG
jgi:molybdopterin synthase sulfur carrier subunit